LVLLFRLSIDFTGGLDFEPVRVSGASHKSIHVPQQHDGPVSITIKFEVIGFGGGELLDTLHEVRSIHLRNVQPLRLHGDLGRPNTYRLRLGHALIYLTPRTTTLIENLKSAGRIINWVEQWTGTTILYGVRFGPVFVWDNPFGEIKSPLK